MNLEDIEKLVGGLLLLGYCAVSTFLKKKWKNIIPLKNILVNRSSILIKCNLQNKDLFMIDSIDPFTSEADII